MPTILTHPVIPVALCAALGRRAIPPRLLAAGMVASVVPDLDVISFAFGIPYESPFGHRGASHSLILALAMALIAWPAAGMLRCGGGRAAAFVFASGASHGLLDALTNGGLGIALLWPFSGDRFFSPWRPIEVSPIGAAAFLAGRGWHTLASELLWVWLPCTVAAASALILRRRRQRRESPRTP